MAKNSKKLQGRILPARLVCARTSKNMTQAELAHRLEVAGASQEHRKITAQTISLYETGRRRVPLEYNEILSNILDVTVFYLRGLTSDPHGNKEEIQEDKEFSEIGITFDMLYHYDGKPVFVQFKNLSHLPAWGIYDADKNRIIFKNFIYNLSPAAQFELSFSVIEPSYMTQNADLKRKMLTYESMMKASHVYIKLLMGDAAIRARYNGWYRHNESKTNLINNLGLTLPYDGLGITYVAYIDDIDESYEISK